jgi:lysophospholipase L1-like esterase
VLVDGDSLAVGTGPYLERLLPSWRVTTSASIGRPTGAGLEVLRAWRGALPHVLVLSLGTNDDSRATAAFREAIRGAMALAGPDRCVVWPSIVRPPFEGVSYRGLNQVLAAEAERHPNLIVVDWARLVQDHPEWRAPDQVHLTPLGYAERARAIAGALRPCS